MRETARRFVARTTTASTPTTEPIFTPIERFVRPFDLSSAPLLRAAVVQTDTRAHTIVVDMHHIVTDGWSTAVLERELRNSVILCPNCRNLVERDYLICPSCTRELKKPCVNCERPLSMEWGTCPYCGTDQRSGEKLTW